MTASEAGHAGAARGEIDRLGALSGREPGAAAFPAVAEAHRRTGRPEEAERVARAGLELRPDALAGRVALGLALLDLGRLDEARAELERVLSSVPDHPLALAGLEASDTAPAAAPAAEDAFAGSFDGDEIDAAFEDARPEEDQMISADSVAASAIRAAELDGSDEGDPGWTDDEGHEDIPVSTRTVADLLERQGHDQDAHAMRAELDGGQRQQILATLERWLDNLRRTAP
jgi:tetratricopeptide (TPR) repeat protein